MHYLNEKIKPDYCIRDMLLLSRDNTEATDKQSLLLNFT